MPELWWPEANRGSHRSLREVLSRLRPYETEDRGMSHDYFSTATALQQHETNVIRNYRRSMAERFRELADEAEAKALREPDVNDQELLIREAATWRWAAAIEDVPEEVVA